MFLYRNTEERYEDNINKEINMSVKNMSFYLLPDFHLFYFIVYLLKRPDVFLLLVISLIKIILISQTHKTLNTKIMVIEFNLNITFQTSATQGNFKTFIFEL